jgi:hypothetical protein
VGSSGGRSSKTSTVIRTANTPSDKALRRSGVALWSTVIHFMLRAVALRQEMKRPLETEHPVAVARGRLIRWAHRLRSWPGVGTDDDAEYALRSGSPVGNQKAAQSDRSTAALYRIPPGADAAHTLIITINHLQRCVIRLRR